MMQLLRNLIWAALILSWSNNPVLSEAAITWKDDVRGWKILVDPSQDNSCFMVSGYEGGSTLRVGFNVKDNNVQFVIGDPKWRSIENGKLYDMSVQFGNRGPWTADGEGWWWSDSSPSLIMNVGFDDSREFDAADFLDEFMRMTFVVVKYDGSEIARLKLTGTNVAMNEVMDCQAALLDGATAGPTDPFSSSRSGDPNDPFK